MLSFVNKGQWKDPARRRAGREHFKRFLFCFVLFVLFCYYFTQLPVASSTGTGYFSVSSAAVPKGYFLVSLANYPQGNLQESFSDIPRGDFPAGHASTLESDSQRSTS